MLNGCKNIHYQILTGTKCVTYDFDLFRIFSVDYSTHNETIMDEDCLNETLAESLQLTKVKSKSAHQRKEPVGKPDKESHIMDVEDSEDEWKPPRRINTRSALKRLLKHAPTGNRLNVTKKTREMKSKRKTNIEGKINKVQTDTVETNTVKSNLKKTTNKSNLKKPTTKSNVKPPKDELNRDTNSTTTTRKGKASNRMVPNDESLEIEIKSEDESEKNEQTKEGNKKKYSATLGNKIKGNKRTQSATLGSKTKYQCEVCHVYLSQSHSLKRHMLLHTGSKCHNCDVCDKKFLCKDDLVKHLRVHSSETPYACTESDCGDKFKYFRQFKSHMVDAHKKDPNTVLPQRRSKVKEEEKPDVSYICTICGRVLGCQSSLSRHMQNHDESLKDRFICDACGKGFIRQSDLKKHNVKHSSEKNIQCDVCGKKFKSRGGLKSHNIIFHLKQNASATNSKDFVCIHCGGIYNNEFSLARHLKRHNKESKQDIINKDLVEHADHDINQTVQIFKKDPIIDAQINDKEVDTLSQNSENQNIPDTEPKTDTTTDEELLGPEVISKITKMKVCNEGDLIDTESTEFIGEIKNATDDVEDSLDQTDIAKIKELVVEKFYSSSMKERGEEQDGKIKCEKCPKAFNNKENLKNHMISHSSKGIIYICDLCGKLFKKGLSLFKHKKLHNRSGTYTCKTCNQQFNSMDRLRQHAKNHDINGKEFSCGHCNKTFNARRNLNNHMLVHTDVKSFVCEQCGKAFRLKQQLKSHVMQHNNDRPHACPVCDKR